MGAFIQGAGKFYRGLCVFILSLMVIIVFTNTVLRYGFNSGIVQGEEILRYLFIWLSFLGIVAVYKDSEHIAVTILTDNISPKAAAALIFAANFLALYAFSVLIRGTVGYMEESGSTVGQLTGIPYRAIISAIFFAAVSCALFVLRDIWRAWQALTAKGE